MGKNQHVVPHERGWAVMGDGNNRLTSIHGLQREAVAAARRIARNQGTDLLVHDRTGRITQWETMIDPTPET
ncbi:hypothetical protein CVU37_13905 [candidate division BRC1 bacterium HGW-BRC1-1]|jgi:hypothetical protein|nr:MAG: hypothetical protein CVU37_13905 [candidate division BRC1 bacterium HGW-BRC1-1]